MGFIDKKHVVNDHHGLVKTWREVPWYLGHGTSCHRVWGSGLGKSQRRCEATARAQVQPASRVGRADAQVPRPALRISFGHWPLGEGSPGMRSWSMFDEEPSLETESAYGLRSTGVGGGDLVPGPPPLDFADSHSHRCKSIGLNLTCQVGKFYRSILHSGYLLRGFTAYQHGKQLKVRVLATATGSMPSSPRVLCPPQQRFNMSYPYKRLRPSMPSLHQPLGMASRKLPVREIVVRSC